MARIVLTGGPGSGKTVAASALVAELPALVLVPEAATQVYTQMATRWDLLSIEERYAAQTRMYQLQIEQEARFAREYPDHTLLLDRGTIDGATYWPDGHEAFWQVQHTSLAAELARYDVVIWLQSSAALGVYDGDASNQVRHETSDDAIAAGERLRELWGQHDNYFEVPARPRFEDKLAELRALIEAHR